MHKYALDFLEKKERQLQLVDPQSAEVRLSLPHLKALGLKMDRPYSYEQLVEVYSKCWKSTAPGSKQEEALHRAYNEVLKKPPSWWDWRPVRRAERPPQAENPRESIHISDLRRLGIAEDAVLTETIVTASFRKKAKIAHPDKGGSHEAFLALEESRKRLFALCKS